MQAFPTRDPGSPGLGLSQSGETRDWEQVRGQSGEEGEVSDALVAVWALLMQQQLLPVEETAAVEKQWMVEASNGGAEELSDAQPSDAMPLRVDHLTGLIGNAAAWALPKFSASTGAFNLAPAVLARAEDQAAVPGHMHKDSTRVVPQEGDPRQSSFGLTAAGFAMVSRDVPAHPVNSEAPSLRETAGLSEQIRHAPASQEVPRVPGDTFSADPASGRMPIGQEDPARLPLAAGTAPVTAKAQGDPVTALSSAPVVDNSAKPVVAKTPPSRRTDGVNRNSLPDLGSPEGATPSETLFSTVVGLQKDWRQSLAAAKLHLERTPASPASDLPSAANEPGDLPLQGTGLLAEPSTTEAEVLPQDTTESGAPYPVETSPGRETDSVIRAAEPPPSPGRQAVADDWQNPLSTNRPESGSAPELSPAVAFANSARTQQPEPRAETDASVPLPSTRLTAFEEHVAMRPAGSQETRTIAIRIPLTESDSGKFRHLDLVFEQRRNDLTLKFHSPNRELQHEVETSMPLLLDRLKTESWLPRLGEMSPVSAHVDAALEAPRRLDSVLQSTQSPEPLREPMTHAGGGQQGFSPEDSPNDRREQQKRSGGRNRKREEEWSSEFVEQLGV